MCPVEVYDIIDGKIDAKDIIAWIECGACQDICPYNVILRRWVWQE